MGAFIQVLPIFTYICLYFQFYFLYYFLFNLA